MEDKKQYHKPAAGIPEAIHPEIGNSSAMEKDSHAFLLRTPDPSKLLDTFLSIPEVKANETDIPTNTEFEVMAETMVVPPMLSEENVQSNTMVAPESHMESGNPPEIVIPEVPDVVEDKDEGRLKVGKSKRKKVEKGNKVNPEEITTPSSSAQSEEKPQKAGKLLRRAAKNINKKEERIKADRIEQKVTPATTLSPYTSWLKNLVGSEYVHPYEDDFAIEQASGGAKQGISETFADLLAAQGYKDQAREMYLRLMEKYPEKSSFFAAKIEALQ